METSQQTSEAANHEQKERSTLFDLTRKVMLASIGAVALAQDELEAFVDRLVERGEIAEKEGKKLIREMMDKRKGDIDEVEERLAKRLEGVLEHTNVPTRADIDMLNEKITALAKKIDDLKKKQSA